MAGYLLDTNVVSEPRRDSPHPGVMAWLSRLADDKDETFLSVLVVGEIRKGVEQLRARDSRRAEVLDTWLSGLVRAYSERILPVTLAVAEEWGRMVAVGQPPPVDCLMAATAKVHRLTLVTRNVADFARTGVPVVNPFEG